MTAGDPKEIREMAKNGCRIHCTVEAFVQLAEHDFVIPGLRRALRESQDDPTPHPLGHLVTCRYEHDDYRSEEIGLAVVIAGPKDLVVMAIVSPPQRNSS